MEKYAKYTKWIMGLVLFFVPTLILAQDVAGSPIWDAFKNLSYNPPIGDMSVIFLGKMFGVVPGVPQLAASGSSILGVVFSVFNAGILTLSGVFLTYNITKIVTETTMDGGSMGKNVTIWTAIRCALSTSLLIPQPVTGYSLINGVVMWVVIQSIGLADFTWNRALDYLKEASPVYAPPTMQIDYTLINYDRSVNNTTIDSTNKFTSVGAADILRSLVCAHSVRGALIKSQNEKNKYLLNKLKENGKLSSEDAKEYANSSKPIPEQSEIFSIYKDTGYTKSGATYSNGAFQFPYIKDESKTPHPLSTYGLNIDSSNIPKNLSGICGTVSYLITKKGNEKDSDFTERADRYIPRKLRGLQEMVNVLDPVAKQLVNDVKPDRDGKSKLDMEKYELYKDSNGQVQYFLKSFSRPIDYSIANQTISNYATVTDYTQLPDIKWPFGADAIMGAASTYQIALAPAQRGAEGIFNADKKKKFEDAKKKGWIAAGGYYRLLASVQDSALKEYDSYRLTGYDDVGKPFSDESITNRDNTVPYLTLFKRATTIDPMTGKTPIGVIDTAYADALGRALAWIYLAYPYAELHGKALSYAVAQAEKNTGAGIEAPILKDLLGIPATGAYIGFIYVRLFLGAVALAIPIVGPIVGVILLAEVPMDFLKYDVNQIFATWNNEMGATSKTKDPIIKLQNVGESMIANAVAYIEQIKIFFIAVTVALSVVAGITQAVVAVLSPFGFAGVMNNVQRTFQTFALMARSSEGFVQTMIFMNLPMGLAVLTPILASGIMLSVYVPLIPYLLFLFGVISWFISVLVLMAAAPIICFLMLWGTASQENPLLSREAEQFLMQIVGVFFRPTLMVIGLITGMVLSYIGVDVLNLGFADISKAVLKDGDGGNVRLIKQMGLVVIYTFTMVSVINMCFSTIHLLYSEAMRIVGISAPAVGMEEKYAEAAKAASTQFAEAGAAGGKEGAVALKGAVLHSKFAKGKQQEQEPEPGADDNDKVDKKQK